MNMSRMVSTFSHSNQHVPQRVYHRRKKTVTTPESMENGILEGFEGKHTVFLIRRKGIKDSTSTLYYVFLTTRRT